VSSSARIRTNSICLRDPWNERGILPWRVPSAPRNHGPRRVIRRAHPKTNLDNPLRLSPARSITYFKNGQNKPIGLFSSVSNGLDRKTAVFCRFWIGCGYLSTFRAMNRAGAESGTGRVRKGRGCQAERGGAAAVCGQQKKTRSFAPVRMTGAGGHGNSLMGNEAGMCDKTEGLLKCDAPGNDFGRHGSSI
jgi:hypothetical protein